jgi:hypothetical protein
MDTSARCAVATVFGGAIVTGKPAHRRGVVTRHSFAAPDLGREAESVDCVSAQARAKFVR